MDKSKAFNDNVRLVYNIAARMVTPEHRDDAIQEGSLGLWNAVQTYDSDNEAKFSTYAGRCIRNSILNYVKKEQNQTGKLFYIDDMEDAVDNVDDTSAILERYETNKEIRKACGNLTPREEAVLSERLLTDEPKTLWQLASEWECSHPSILRDEARIKNKIKEGYKHD